MTTAQAVCRSQIEYTTRSDAPNPDAVLNVSAKPRDAPTEQRRGRTHTVRNSPNRDPYLVRFYIQIFHTQKLPAAHMYPWAGFPGAFLLEKALRSFGRLLPLPAGLSAN